MLLRLRRLRTRTCTPPPARAASLPGRAPAPRRGPCAFTPLRPQLLHRVRALTPSAGVSRDRGLPPRWRANGCARVSSTADRRASDWERDCCYQATVEVIAASSSRTDACHEAALDQGRPVSGSATACRLYEGGVVCQRGVWCRVVVLCCGRGRAVRR